MGQSTWTTRKHRTMLSFATILAGFCFANVHGDNHLDFIVCQEHVVIGGIYYDRVDNFTTYDSRVEKKLLECYNSTKDQYCVYQMKGILGSRYCLKFGNQKTVEAQVQPIFCTYLDSQYKYRPLQENTVADNATDCSEKCTKIDGKPPYTIPPYPIGVNPREPPVCRGWSYGPDNECYLYPFPESLDNGLIKSLTGWTSGPRGCILGGPSIPPNTE